MSLIPEGWVSCLTRLFIVCLRRGGGRLRFWFNILKKNIQSKSYGDLLMTSFLF